MSREQTKKDIVSFFLNKGVLISPELLGRINQEEDLDKLHKELISGKETSLVLTKEIKQDNNDHKQITETEKVIINNNSVKEVFTYKEESIKRNIQDFVLLFNHRYKALEKILRSRNELQDVLSINRILNKKDKDKVAFIGLVTSKRSTSKGGIMLELEDPTGIIKVFINNNMREMFNQAKDITLDEAIGVVGSNGDKIVFANNILWPDIPLNKELKKSKDEAYALFFSDVHVGSKKFLKKEFNNFLDWINGKTGNDDQKEIAKKVKYIFIVGDLVDGVGIYPGQESELEIKDLKEQYEEFARLFKQIPDHIQLIISPGNHDAMRIAEPQLPIYKDFAKSLWELKNTKMVSNPAIVNIHSSETFPGFDVLLYHGYSFDYFISNVDSLRNNNGYERSDLVMKYLLQRRHLAPTYTSTPYIPERNKDYLVIETIPDFFATGHVHKSTVANYRNVTTIGGSCWQSKTAFQEKVGHNPEPCRIPAVNLKTRQIKILKFIKTT